MTRVHHNNPAGAARLSSTERNSRLRDDINRQLTRIDSLPKNASEEDIMAQLSVLEGLVSQSDDPQVQNETRELIRSLMERRSESSENITKSLKMAEKTMHFAENIGEAMTGASSMDDAARSFSKAAGQALPVTEGLTVGVELLGVYNRPLEERAEALTGLVINQGSSVAGLEIGGEFGSVYGARLGARMGLKAPGIYGKAFGAVGGAIVMGLAGKQVENAMNSNPTVSAALRSESTQKAMAVLSLADPTGIGLLTFAYDVHKENAENRAQDEFIAQNGVDAWNGKIASQMRSVDIRLQAAIEHGDKGAIGSLMQRRGHLSSRMVVFNRANYRSEAQFQQAKLDYQRQKASELATGMATAAVHG